MKLALLIVFGKNNLNLILAKSYKIRDLKEEDFLSGKVIYVSDNFRLQLESV